MEMTAMSLTLTRPPVAPLEALVLTLIRGSSPGVPDDVTPAVPALSRPDIVDEWGMQSFPASDPPSNW
jgi:hypothetical protein